MSSLEGQRPPSYSTLWRGMLSKCYWGRGVQPTHAAFAQHSLVSAFGACLHSTILRIPVSAEDELRHYPWRLPHLIRPPHPAVTSSSHLLSRTGRERWARLVRERWEERQPKLAKSWRHSTWMCQ
eukprot:gene17930-biopygen3845